MAHSCSNQKRCLSTIANILTKSGHLLAQLSRFILFTTMPLSGKLFPESSQLFQLTPEQTLHTASRSQLILIVSEARIQHHIINDLPELCHLDKVGSVGLRWWRSITRPWKLSVMVPQCSGLIILKAEWAKHICKYSLWEWYEYDGGAQ